MGSGLQAVPPLLNGGARGTWLSANPAGNSLLAVAPSGVVSSKGYNEFFDTLRLWSNAGDGRNDLSVYSKAETDTLLSNGYQPLDADLTSIAALTTTAFGRSLLTQADAPTARTTLGAFASTGGTMTGALSFSGTTHAGVRLNNLTTTERNALTGAAGMAIWNTTDSRINVHNGTGWTAGFVRLDGDTMTGSLLATSFEARNATTATSVAVNNTWTSSTNRETGYIRWASNILSIGTEKGSGGGSAREMRLETDGVTRLRFGTTGLIHVGNETTPVYFGSSTNGGSFNVAGVCLSFFQPNTSQNPAYNFLGNPAVNTSGTFATISVVQGAQPTSGTGTYAALQVISTINQTGGANGITRGFFVSPTLTAAADWRSFDTNVNSGFAYHSSGTAPSRFGGVVQFPVLTVATLPAASGVPRARAFVSDSTLAFNSTNLASTLTGGGANFVPVYSDGTNWRIG